MERPKQISRRGLGLLLASTASPLPARSMQAAQASPPTNDLDDARGRVQQQAEALRKVKVADETEPAFRFVP